MVTKFKADASPEKRLFISLLTRDIPMVAAFLDLIDNSVNAAIEPFADRLSTAADYVEILKDESVKPETTIEITFGPDEIIIYDNAPGISSHTARNHVFKFGRSLEEENLSDRLSVYGLGLKRAFFKLGNKVEITSDHTDGGFKLDLNVEEWAKDRTQPWKFELEERDPAPPEDCGTTIMITQVYDDIKRRLDDGVFEGQLSDAISRTYAYFLTKFVTISVNGARIPATNLRVGSNNATDSFVSGDVTCTVTAGLGTPDEGKYRDKGSGWFVFCNGRTVISADKSAKTGWNNNPLPIFQPKHRPFLGTVYFVSRHADQLPWDTTKSDIDEDSEIWQSARRVMATVGKPVISFLDRRYTDEGTEVAVKELEEASKNRVEAMEASVSAKRSFKAPKAPKKTTSRIQYDAKIKDIERIADYLSQPGMSGSDVGRHTFNFFLKNEVGDE